MTYWEKVESIKYKVEKISLLRITINSGCRHQIRCHLASIGYPIIGDRLYMTSAQRKKYKEHLTEDKIELVSSGLEILDI